MLDGRIQNSEVVVVVSNRVECGAVSYAKDHGIPTTVYPCTKSGKGMDDDELLADLKEREIDAIVLAGYMKMIPPNVVRAFPRRILNIHPALLPSFGGKGMYGMNVHRAVVAMGARFSGPTVHFVDEIYDHGPILAQAVVAVSPTDSPEQVAAKVLKEEHRLYPEAVAALCEGRITWREDGIPIMWTPR
ncbi:unnamed protein product [Pedinophyceae sp. YPF-701]|nr:unnamed protein product [Pedinophyceae sp. YPF-701]